MSTQTEYYPVHPQDNPYYNQTFGPVKRPQQSTLEGMALAIANLPPVTKIKRKSRALSRRKPEIIMFKSLLTNESILRQKCGPSYFPVNNNLNK